MKIRRRFQPLFHVRFAYSLARLWWFNRRSRDARARRLGV